MFRVLPVILLLTVAACSRDTKTPSETQTPATESAAAKAPAKPLPAQLPDILARVNGETVTRMELEDSVRSLEARARGPIPPDQRDQIYRQVIEQLVGYKLLQQEVKSRKIAVTDADVDARLAEIKKQFPSEDLFMQTIISQGLTLERLKTDQRRDMAIQKLIEGAIADKVAVTPQQVEEFYKSNPDQFKQGERVRASHILIAVPEAADAAAKAQAKTKAEGILKDLKAGKDFAALAKQHSQDPGSAVNGGDLGFFQEGAMVGPFNDAAFSLKPGATSDLVETQFGFHIIKVTDKQAGRTIPLAEVRPRLEEYLSNVNKETQSEAFVKSLRAKGKVEILV